MISYILDLALMLFLLPVIFVIAISTKRDRKSMGLSFIFNPLRIVFCFMAFVIICLVMIFEMLIRKIFCYSAEHFSNSRVGEYKLFRDEIIRRKRNKYNSLISDIKEKIEKESDKIKSLIEGCHLAVIRGLKIN